ncbi:MAG: hypothetical protein KatS3mg111_1509 [Pirellulaceae bacterium]|nr:MAG: hypothetical protein KatS3mg111_1509 [Pirellulaceae bacterium]
MQATVKQHRYTAQLSRGYSALLGTMRPLPPYASPSVLVRSVTFHAAWLATAGHRYVPRGNALLTNSAGGTTVDAGYH